MSKLEEVALGCAMVFGAMLLGEGARAIGAKTVVAVLLACSLLYLVGFLSRDHGTAKLSKLPSQERESDADNSQP